MKVNEGMFAVKLQELEQQYGRMRSRLRLLQREDHSKIRKELQMAADECRQNELLLQKNVEGSRSPAVSALAGAQLAYCRRVGKLLKRKLPRCLSCEGSTPHEDEAEAASLYAEYAIDFAVQSARYALLAALRAIDLQMDAEEQKGEACGGLSPKSR
ncbi:MAG TPA: hypothetical protein IAB55_03980 [Candidatus Merdivicinus faecavium]|nr:hypothetical protein [Candidatus Merdivicinus faecavium]